MRFVADHAGCPDDPGVKGKAGVLASQPSQAAFLRDLRHTIVFHYTPKHSSRLNRVEIWLSILVRKLLKHGSFASVADLERQVLAFIAYYNCTMAKPFKWIKQGRALVA